MNRKGRCVGEFSQDYDSVNKVPLTSGKQNIQCQRKDIEKLVEQLHSKHKVFLKKPARYHKHFNKHKRNIMNLKAMDD